MISNKLRTDLDGERRVYFLLDSQELQYAEKFKMRDKVRFYHTKSSNHMKSQTNIKIPLQCFVTKHSPPFLSNLVF